MPTTALWTADCLESVTTKGTFTVNPTVKTAVFWVVMLCTAVLLWRVVQTGGTAGEKNLTFREFYKEVQFTLLS